MSSNDVVFTLGPRHWRPAVAAPAEDGGQPVRIQAPPAPNAGLEARSAVVIGSRFDVSCLHCTIRRPGWQHRQPGAARRPHRGRAARPHHHRPAHLPEQGPQHLRRRRHHRLSEPPVDLDGAGPHRALPCLRRVCCRPPRRHFSMASMRFPEISTVGQSEEQGARVWRALQGRPRALPGNVARQHHGRQFGKADLRAGCSAPTSSARAPPSSSISARR